MANSNLISQLHNIPNFDKIKKSFIEYLKTNDVLRDMNFTGSATNVLLDICCALYLNCQTYSQMALGESFLDTALFRKSILSKARMLGYKPFQYKPSVAKLRITFNTVTTTDSPPLYFPAGVVFSGNNNRGQWYFSTRDNFEIKLNEANQWFADIDVYEGIKIQESWIQDQWYQNRYIFQHSKLDTTTLEVNVQNPNDTYTYLFNTYDTVENLGPQEKIFYWREIDNDKIEIYFGDNIISKKLEPGWIINASCYSCGGLDANGIQNFICTNKGSLEGFDFTVSTIMASIEGGNKQTDESIKFEAPHYFQRQDRNVTAEDYRTFIVSRFGASFKHVHVWGGEDNIPPRYGETLMCFIPNEGVYITEQLKYQIKKELDRYNVLTIRPVILEADPTFIDIVCNVTYDKNTSQLRGSQVQEQVGNIFRNEYIQEDIASYKVSYSSTINKIQLIDDSINDISFSETFVKSFLPRINLNYSYRFDFQNPIKPDTIYSDVWTSVAYPNIGFTCKIMDDGEGNLFLYIDNLKQNIIGKVYYETGVIEITNFKFEGMISSDSLNIFCIPLQHNNRVLNENIFLIRNVTVNATDSNDAYLDRIPAELK